MGWPAAFSGATRYSCVAEGNLATVVTQRETAVAAVDELARHVEEAALPDFHDGQQARIEGIVNAVRIADVDAAARGADQRTALQAHRVIDQPLQAVGHGVVGRRRGLVVELDHRPALARLVERREVVADRVELHDR